MMGTTSRELTPEETQQIAALLEEALSHTRIPEPVPAVAAEPVARTEVTELDPAANADEFGSFLDRIGALTAAEIGALHDRVYWAYQGLGYGFGSDFDRIARGHHAIRSHAPSAPVVHRLVMAAYEAHPGLSSKRHYVLSEVRRYLHDLALYYAIPARERKLAADYTVLQDLQDPWRRVVLRNLSVRDIRPWHIALLVFVGLCAVFPVFAVGAGVLIGFFLLAMVAVVCATILLNFIRGY